MTGTQVAQETLFLIGRLISFALLLQSIEFIKIKKNLTEQGIWRWSELRSEYQFLPQFIQRFLDFIMNEKYFTSMMKVRLELSIVLFLFPYLTWLFVFLFLSTFLVTLRWRGSFNGGSDYLMLIILLTLCVGLIIPGLAKAALWYITIQVLSSYFLAGLHKVRKEKWSRGIAVAQFVNSPNYDPPSFVVRIINNTSMAKIITWAVLVFELAFPLAIINSKLCAMFLVMGFCFHLGNFVVFGLNRFFWVWTASYPALWYCAYSLSAK